MSPKKVYTVPHRRKRESKTDYRRRLALIKSGKNRLVIRKSNKHTTAQLVAYSDKGDKVVASAHTTQLKDYGWKLGCANIPAAYLVGLLLGTRAKGKSAIVDLGLQTPIRGSRLYAVLQGAKDAGLTITVSENVAPSEERIQGEHIAQAMEKVQKGMQFATYKDKDITKMFEKTKEKILKDNGKKKKTKKEA